MFAKISTAFLLGLATIAQIQGAESKCTSKICVQVELGEDLFVVGHHGIHHGVRKFTDQDDRNNMRFHVSEPMHEKAGTGTNENVVPCKSHQTYCFKSRSYKDRVISPRYQNKYDMSFETEIYEVERLKELGNFESQKDFHKFAKQAVRNLWSKFSDGHQYFGVGLIKDDDLYGHCPSVFGGGKGYIETKRPRCVEICNPERPWDCNLICTPEKKWKPRTKCSQSQPRGAIPTRVLINFIDTSNDDILLAKFQFDILGRQTIYKVKDPRKSPGCSAEFEAVVRGLSFLPVVGNIFGFLSYATSSACKLTGQRSQDEIDGFKDSLQVPENIMFLPKEFNSGNNTITQELPDSVYDCSKCWPSDQSKYLTETDVPGSLFELTEEGNREGNHCSLCFIQQSVLDSDLEYQTAIDDTCESVLGQSVETLTKILPQYESEKLVDARETCLKARAGTSGDTQLSNGAVAGMTFGATVAVAAGIGVALYKRQQRDEVVSDSVLESFSTSTEKL